MFSLLIWRRPERTFVIVGRRVPVACATSAWVTSLESIKCFSISAGVGFRIGAFSISLLSINVDGDQFAFRLRQSCTRSSRLYFSPSPIGGQSAFDTAGFMVQNTSM